ncbi:MAG: hypothetical protein WC889_19930, partial [Myxococcota bacterium]
WEWLVYEKEENAVTDAVALDDGGAIVSGVLRPDGVMHGTAFAARVGADGKVLWKTEFAGVEGCWGVKVVPSGGIHLVVFNSSPGTGGGETFTVWAGLDDKGREQWRRRLPEAPR